MLLSLSRSFFQGTGHSVQRCLLLFRSVLQEISRRELRKALERNGGVTTLREEEILVLCDSLDPKRRGTVHLSDVRDSLSRGLVVGPSNSEFEVLAREKAV